MTVEIVPVLSRADRRAFRRLPFRLYESDPHWVPPLNRDIRGFLDASRHPFAESGDMAFFLARKNGRIAGRIAAIENRAHNAYHGDRVGFFGFFESEDDSEIARALFHAAAGWARARGLTSLRGPCSPSTNYECGFFVEGDPGPPALMMPHNPPHYLALVESEGFKKAMDLLAFTQAPEPRSGDRWERIAKRVRERAGVEVRTFDMKRFKREVATIIEIYHDAWSKNWGFVPLNPPEVARMASELKPLIRPSLGTFVMKDGKEVAFQLAFPDYNRIMIDLEGRILPFGIFKLLGAKNKLRHIRLLLMGVRKEYQHLGLDVLLYNHVSHEAIKQQLVACESSWILETNTPMINTLERSGARRYRTYRLYERPIDGLS